MLETNRQKMNRKQNRKTISKVFLFISFGIFWHLLNRLALAQQPQAQSGTPIYDVNAKYVQGMGPGYWPTAGSGLTLNLTAGTAVCDNSASNYAGGTLTLTASASNYVYLDLTNSCAPAFNTTGFTDSTIPIAVVVTGTSTITSVTDVRSWFTGRQVVNNVAYASRFAGANAGAKIAAAITALPATGGTVDARGLQGAQAISTDMFASVPTTKPVRLLLGVGTYSVSATQNPRAHGTEVLGVSRGGVFSTGGTVLKWTGASGGTMFNCLEANALRFEDLVIDPNGLLATAFQFGNDLGGNTGNVRVERVNIPTAGAANTGTTVAATGLHPCMVELYGPNGALQDSYFEDDTFRGATCAADSGVSDNTWVRVQFGGDNGAYGFVLGSPSSSTLLESPLFTNSSGSTVFIAVSATGLVQDVTVIKPWFEAGAGSYVFKRVGSTSPAIEVHGMMMLSPKFATGNGSGNFIDLTGMSDMTLVLRDYTTTSGADTAIVDSTSPSSSAVVLENPVGGPPVTVTGAKYFTEYSAPGVTSNNFTFTQDVTVDGGFQVGKSLNSAVNIETFSTTPTFDASTGNTQKITLTGNVTASALVNAGTGEKLNFIICQDSSGSHTFVWPGNIKGGMTIGSTASKCSAQSFIFDGTNAYALSPGVANM